jgi:hypothetical protein
MHMIATRWIHACEPVLFLKIFFLVCTPVWGSSIRDVKKKSGYHPNKDLAKYGYKPEINYNYLIAFFNFWLSYCK